MLYYKWPIDLWAVSMQKTMFMAGFGILGAVVGMISFILLFLRLAGSKPSGLLFLSVLFVSYSIGAILGYLLTKTERFKYRFAS